MIEPVASVASESGMKTKGKAIPRKPQKRTDGTYSQAKLTRFDELLQQGASNDALYIAAGEPGEPEASSTFYKRLKKSKKRIEVQIRRRLVDA